MKTIIFAAALTIFSGTTFAHDTVFAQDYSESDHKNSELCVKFIKENLKDPFTAKFEPFKKVITSEKVITGSGDVAFEKGDENYFVWFNAKNIFGAYTGKKIALCTKPKATSELRLATMFSGFQ